MADEEEPKRLIKAVWWGSEAKAFVDPNDEVRSKQLTEDPFTGMATYGTLVRMPPYSLEQLVLLSESHPIHAAALEQKAVDVIASGVEWNPLIEEANEVYKDEMQAWLEGLACDATFIEILEAMWLDYETVGWGILEVGRDPSGIVRKMWHVPAHTVRAHEDNKRFLQMRGGRFIWFKRWNTFEEQILASDGRMAWQGVGFDKLANEFLVFRKPSRRSTWYGIPAYIAALGHIALALAARDYNVKFFSNAREPRHLIVISGVDEDKLEQLANNLTEELKTQHAAGADPHRNLILPIAGAGVNVTVERMTLPQNDLHFTRLLELTDRNILIAHRMPPDRLGYVTRGSLGGSVTADIIFAYKNGVVSPGQTVLCDRLNKFLAVEYPKAKGLPASTDLQWEATLESLDLSDELMDTNVITIQVKSNLITLNEGRSRLGLGDRDGLDVTLAEFLAQFGGAPVVAAATVDHPLGLHMEEEIIKRLEAADELMQALSTDVEELMARDDADHSH
jgi:PBSX family phage portal protein